MEITESYALADDGDPRDNTFAQFGYHDNANGAMLLNGANGGLDTHVTEVSSTTTKDGGRVATYRLDVVFNDVMDPNDTFEDSVGVVVAEISTNGQAEFFELQMHGSFFVTLQTDKNGAKTASPIVQVAG